NYILEKLNNDPRYRKYKISILAEEAGFSSHSMFTTNFKSITGISPSEFVKYIQKRDVESFT
ncbi:AraC family transcriptional regulator, partial [Elizabethkingia miricola]